MYLLRSQSCCRQSKGKFSSFDAPLEPGFRVTSGFNSTDGGTEVGFPEVGVADDGLAENGGAERGPGENRRGRRRKRADHLRGRDSSSDDAGWQLPPGQAIGEEGRGETASTLARPKQRGVHRNTGRHVGWSGGPDHPLPPDCVDGHL